MFYFLLVGAVSGWFAGQIWKGSGFGLIGNVIVGILGGMIGGYLAGKMGISHNSTLMEILVAAGGAWVLLFLLRLIRG